MTKYSFLCLVTTLTLQAVPAPLKKPRPPLLNQRPPVFPEGGAAQSHGRQVQLQPAAAGNSDHSYRVCLWLCAATTVLCFAALVAAAVTVAFKSSDELSRSFVELERALKGEGSAGAVLDPSMTQTAPSNRTTQTGGIVLDVSKRPLNRTDFVFQAD
ncbi:uncharacterized protein LOC142780338 [Rhipicephalus microplus]|uniref:uncharacterized protein LOC142780338 n=1 Tax=Rhipicephalus microplus TaxID=6941 RepID=UPI003F6AA9E1